jgi:hypothetical protein
MIRALCLIGAMLCILPPISGCNRITSGESGSATLTPAQQAELAAYVLDSPPADLIKADIDLDGKAHIVGYLLSPRQAQYPPGTEVKLTIVWRSDVKLDSGWLLFSHLLSQSGQQLENIDDRGPLRSMAGVTGQPLPPSRWAPGKFYKDELSFKVPADPSPVVVVTAGIHNGKARLPIVGPGGDKNQRGIVARLPTGAPEMRFVVKQLIAPRLDPAAAPITIDGKLDEPAWASAASTGPFVDVGSGRENPALAVQGSARLLWDDAFLYAGFEVSDKTVRGGFPPDARDPHLWNRDTVEIMIDPDGDGDNQDYYEIQINPQNLVFDTQYDDYNHPNGGGKGPFGHEEWSAGLTSAVLVHGTIDEDSDADRGYTVEAKIPWGSFTKAKQAPPAIGAVWRMNFYAMQNNGGAAWSPILGQGNFHRASRFGRVVWMAAGPPRP